MEYRLIFTNKLLAYFFITLLGGYICYRYGFSYDISPIDTIYYILIVFPLGVILGHAEKRRFRVVELISTIKGKIFSLAYAYRDWDHLKDTNERYKKDLSELAGLINEYLGSDNDVEEDSGHLSTIDDVFSRLSSNGDGLRNAGVSGPEIAKTHGYIDDIINAFEILKGYKKYNTSRLILVFLETVLIIGGIILVPHFIANGFYGIFVSPVITTTFLVLVNIENILDNPLIRYNITDTIDLDLGESFGDKLQHIFLK